MEGGNRHNERWAWEEEGRIEGGARSGLAADHWTRFREDLRLASDLGLNSYRFSIEWSRIEPEPGRFDGEALEWYRELIAECERRGLMPMATLHHFTSRNGGFTWTEAPERFRLFTRHIARTLGPRIPLWCTVNEPMVLVAGTYLGTFMPPAKFSPARASLACAGLLRAHVAAYDTLRAEIPRREGPWASHPVQIGIAHNLLVFMPDRAWHPLERIMTRVFWRFYNRSWLDAGTGRPPRFGVPGFLPAAPVVREALGRQTCDFIGVNYYTKAYVQWRPRAASHDRPSGLPLGVTFARRKEVCSDVEWAIHPQGLRRILDFVAEFGLPIYITENGIADARDEHRPEYLRTHLAEAAGAIADGIDIRGYYHWSLLDNFEWIKGFGPRFGLYRVDFETPERVATESARRLAGWIAELRSQDPEGLRPRASLFTILTKS